MSASGGTPRRTRTSREEARENMLQATLVLLDDHDPDQLTVRQIAERAGHHHRFVQDWFGGKAGLLLEAMTVLSAELAQEVDMRSAGPEPDPRVARVVRLMNWLVVNAPDQVSGERMRPLVTRIENFYQDRFGVPEEDARVLARHATASLAGYVLFSGALGFAAGDFARVAEFAFELGRVYGTRPGE